MGERYRYLADYPYLKKSQEEAKKFIPSFRRFCRYYGRANFPLGLKPGDKILDIGSGIGEIGHFFAFMGVRTASLEINEAAVQAGKVLWGAERNNQPLIAEANRLPFSDKSLSTAVSFDVFEHFPTEEYATMVMDEVNRVVSGRVIFHKITVLENLEYMERDPSHCLKWTEKQWVDWFSQRGWEVAASPRRKNPFTGQISFGNFLLKKES